jgi:hypothetical protein
LACPPGSCSAVGSAGAHGSSNSDSPLLPLHLLLVCLLFLLGRPLFYDFRLLLMMIRGAQFGLVNGRSNLLIVMPPLFPSVFPFVRLFIRSIIVLYVAATIW